MAYSGVKISSLRERFSQERRSRSELSRLYPESLDGQVASSFRNLGIAQTYIVYENLKTTQERLHFGGVTRRDRYHCQSDGYPRSSGRKRARKGCEAKS